MKMNRLLIALGTGLAAAALTKEQERAFFEPVLDVFKGAGFKIEEPTYRNTPENNISDINTTIPGKKQPRGIRNNNPGNIRYTGTPWQGLDNPPSDGEFARFVDVKYGIRAMNKILDSYASRGLTSISAIISTWAPPSENNTDAYISSVANELDWLAGATLPLDKRPQLIAAIIKHENGMQPFDVATINSGVQLA